MSFKRIQIKARMTGKPMPDFVIVKDYGKAAGPVLFFPLDDANPGQIQCYSAMSTPNPKTQWAVDDMMMFDEVSLGYFYKGRAPKKYDIRVQLFLDHYERSVGLTPVHVYKDRAEYRAYRYKL